MMYDRWLEEPYQNEDKESDAFWEWVSGEYELLHGSFSDDNAIYLSNAGFIVKIKDYSWDAYDADWDVTSTDASDEFDEVISEKLTESTDDELIEYIMELLGSDQEKKIKFYKKLKGE